MTNEKVQTAQSMAEDQAKKTQDAFNQTKQGAENLASSAKSEVDATKQQAAAVAEGTSQVIGAIYVRTIAIVMTRSGCYSQAAGTLMDHAKQATENAVQQSAQVVEKAIEDQMKAAEEKIDDGEWIELYKLVCK